MELNSTMETHSARKIEIYFCTDHMLRLVYCSSEWQNNIGTIWKIMLLMWMKVVVLYGYIYTDIYVLSSCSYLKGCDYHYSVCKVIMVTWTIISEKLWAVFVSAEGNANLQEVALALDKLRTCRPISFFPTVESECQVYRSTSPEHINSFQRFVTMGFWT